MDADSTTLDAVNELASEAAAAAQERGESEPMPDEMLRAVAAANGREDLLKGLAAFLKQHAALAAVFHYDFAIGQRLSDRVKRLDRGGEIDEDQMSAALDGLCAQACDRGTTQLRSTTDGFPTPTVVAPIKPLAASGEALCVLLGAETSQAPQRVAELLQFAVAQIHLWDARHAAERAEQEARSSNALLELVAKLESSDDLRSGCLDLVHGLQSFLGCERVAVGICRRPSRHCRLQALSGFASFDKNAEVTTAIEAVMDETLLLDEMFSWPPDGENQRAPARTQEQLLTKLGAHSVLSVPLYDANGDPAGACLCLNRQDGKVSASAKEFLRGSQQHLGTSLYWLQRTRGRWWSCAWRSLCGRFPRQRLAVALVLFAILAILLAWPRPHKIACDCQLQPVVRRFIAAPYDGTLQETLVQPGDIVGAGDVLARMDGRETRLELSALEAEYGRARKAWDVSLSLDDIHDAQQAKLEMKRLELKMQLLQEQQQNLQIRSPLRGIVVSGDLEKSEGIPLSVGQPLFEIAPLQRMNVEIHIPEVDIAHVENGMEARIRLDAYPRQRYAARLTHIVPRAEVRDDQFVFLAEAELDNPQETLRPGMNGRASLMGPRRSTAWLLFHKPYESLLMLLGW